MNAWEQPGLTAEERSLAALTHHADYEFRFGEEEVSTVASAIRAAEASAVAAERKRCVRAIREALTASWCSATRRHMNGRNAIAIEAITRINQGEKE